MLNKNDLRYLKTEKLIKETYFILKKNNNYPIKVNELCKKALINKSTFYAHYETIDALHLHLCEELIEKIMDESLSIDCFLTNIRAFVISIIETLQVNFPLIQKMFGNDKIQLVSCIENYLLKHYSRVEKIKEKEIIFTIGGASHLLMYDQSKEAIETAILFIKKIIL